MRFGFGKNWQRFLRTLSNQRIQAATDSLVWLLGTQNLKNARFLDAGCGSGLFSLGALHLGAKEVVSFDCDAESVECARFLNREFGPYINWTISEGSVLDREWLGGLGRFDIVYSWGVLHHTGAMWAAMDNICASVDKGGVLCVSIYNDQGLVSEIWLLIKRFYNVSPRLVRQLLVLGYLVPVSMLFVMRGLIGRRPLHTWFPRHNERGMHYYYDTIDWLGGYPFETAKPDEVIDFFRTRGLALVSLQPKRGSGCNEFVFKRTS